MSTIKVLARRRTREERRNDPKCFFETIDGRTFDIVGRYRSSNVDEYVNEQLYVIRYRGVHHSDKWPLELYPVPVVDLVNSRYPRHVCWVGKNRYVVYEVVK